jgi:hypothetical protein
MEPHGKSKIPYVDSVSPFHAKNDLGRPILQRHCSALMFRTLPSELRLAMDYFWLANWSWTRTSMSDVADVMQEDEAKKRFEKGHPD